ncbi:hypothetical protein [Tautonia plasticadhaerens]|nr:hypothetical protein [Tautonia plasticadhaerens]
MAPRGLETTRKVSAPEFLSLVALFGAIDAPDPITHAKVGLGEALAAASAATTGPPPARVALGRSTTFAIHWEPIDHDAALVSESFLSDGWVRIPMDRSAT